MKKRIVCLLLVLSMLLGALPAVSATEATQGPQFASYYLTLNESIDMNFRLSGYDPKTEPFNRVVFYKDGVKVDEIKTLPAPVNDSYVFKFTELSPDELGSVVRVELYTGEGDGTLVDFVEKSVKDYCEDVLAYNGDNPKLLTAELKTLVVDLLNYGAAFQEYKAGGATVKFPVNEDLDDTDKSYATQGAVKLESNQNTGSQDDKAIKWNSFGLTLENVVGVYFLFEAANMEGLTLRISVAGKPWEITTFTKESNGLFRADFNGLSPAQMKETISAQVFDGDVAVSTILTTSIESYAAKIKAGDYDEILEKNGKDPVVVKTVVTEMMKYGNAAKYWAESKDDMREEEGAINVLYVSSNASAGTGDGSFNNPFASIEEARNEIREIKTAGDYPTEGITVCFRGGQYRIQSKVAFDSSDSGEDGAPVVYKVYNDETVEFVGGVSFNASAFEPITDEAVLNRLPESARGNVKQLTLSELGVTDLGQMHVYGMAAGYFGSDTVQVQKNPPPELFFNGEAMTVSRYPNEDEGWLSIYSVIDTGDVIQNWTDSAYGNDKIPESERNPENVRGSTFTVPRQIRSRMLRWSEASDIWVYGFWKENWSDQSMPVEFIHAGTGTVKTEIPSGKQITAGKRFYFYNLLEELDAPGEYYVERGADNHGILYAYLPEAEGTLTYSTLGSQMINLNGVKYMEFQGIDFVGGRSRAMEISNAEHVVIRDAEIANFARNAINLIDCIDVTVTGCHIYETGEGGISVSYTGDNEACAEAKRTLTSMGIVIENCEIHDFSRIKATYASAISTGGVGMIVRNCKIYNADHMAVSLGGNDTIIENCEIFNVLRTADDSGVFYVGFAKEQMGVVIRNNYIHDIISCGNNNGTDISVVYLDDTKDGVTVESNLFVNISGRGALINGGWDNNFRNNVLVNVDTECSLGCIGMNNTDRYNLKTGGNYAGYRAVCASGNTAYEKYPHWADKMKDLYTSENPVNAPKNNVIENNILFNVKNPIKIGTKDGVWTEQNSKDNNTISDGYAYDTLEQIGFVDYANGDFTLAETSPLRDIAGFVAYDFSKMGLYDEGVQKPKGYGGSDAEYPTPSIGKIMVGEGLTISATEFIEEFNESLDQWTVEAPSGAAKVEAGKLNIVMNNTDTVDLAANFGAECMGRIVYTVEDFTINPNGSESMDSNILIVKGKDISNKVVDLLNLKVFITEDGSMVFGVIDGDGVDMTDTPCEAGQSYNIQVICDPSTGSYDVTVNGNRIIIGWKLSGYVYTFTGVGINHTNHTEDTAPVVTYGGITARPAKLVLYEEDFSSEDALDPWKLDDTYTSTTEIADGALKVVYNGDKVNRITRFDEPFSGKIVYELDFTMDTKCTNLDPSIIIVKGTTAAGGEASLTTMKVDEVGGKFSYYAGASTLKTVKWENGKTYRIIVVCSTDTDTYSFYAFDADAEIDMAQVIAGNVDEEAVKKAVVVQDGKLLGDAVAFTGICIDQKLAPGTEPPATATCTYDNIRVTSADGEYASFVGADVSTDNESTEEMTVLVEDTFDNGTDNWNVGDCAKISDEQLMITLPAGGPSIHYALAEKLPSDQYLCVEFELTVNGGTNTTFEAGILLQGKNANGETKTAANINLKGGTVQALGKHTGVSYKAGTKYKIKIVSNPLDKTFDVYFAGKKIVSKVGYTNGVISWDTLLLMVKENNTSGDLNACYDNFTISKIKTLPTDDFSDGNAADWTKKAGTSTVQNGMLVLRGGSETYARREFPNETETIEIEWEYMLDRNGSTDMDSGFALKFGDDSILEIGAKIPTDGTEYVFYARDGGDLEEAAADSYAFTGKVCKDMMPYQMKVIVDLERNCYELFIDGESVGEVRRLLLDAKKLNGIEAFANSDTTGSAVAYFDEIKSRITDEKIGVLHSNDFSNLPGEVSTNGDGATYSLTTPYTGSVVIELRMKPTNTNECKVLLRQSSGSLTFVNCGLMNGKCHVGDGGINGTTSNINDWNDIKIVTDYANSKFTVYVNGNLIADNRDFYNINKDPSTRGHAFGWLGFANGGTDTFYVDDLVIYKAG